MNMQALSLATMIVGAVVVMPPAAATVVDIEWDAQQRFERRVVIGPGGFAELCGRLARGVVVDWRYRAQAPVDFNIHYHVGEDVVFPAKQQGASAQRGSLRVAQDQDYCWMWSNRANAAVSLQVRLARQPGR